MNFPYLLCHVYTIHCAYVFASPDSLFYKTRFCGHNVYTKTKCTKETNVRLCAKLPVKHERNMAQRRALCLNGSNMPPQNSLPDPAQPDQGDSLPNPMPPSEPIHSDEVNLANAHPNAHHAPPSGYTPTEVPQADVPQLHPQDFQQDFPAPAAPKKEDSRYAFFMETKPKEKKTLIPKRNNTFAWVIICGVGLLIILGSLGVVLNANRTKQTAGNSATLVGIINRQQEIIRVSGLGIKNAQSSDLANFIITTNLSVKSSQQELISYTTKHGVKIDTKKLSKAVADPNTDKILASAQAASVYDSTFRRVMLGMLDDYQKTLQDIGSKATLQSEQDIVNKNIANAELLHNDLVVETSQ
jgi:hypothetical protein